MSLPEPFQSVDKAALARRFGAAAQHYDHHAHFQREVGAALLAHLPAHSVEHLLDLGCGSGYFLPQLQQRCQSLYALDLAEGMLQAAKERVGNKALYLCGDAEQLPLQAQSLDIIFSNLAVQWCASPERAFASLSQVLKPSGELFFSTLLDGSLSELKSAFAAIEKRPQANRFLSRERLQRALALAGFTEITIEVVEWSLHYPSLKPLLHDLKGIGASQRNDNPAPRYGRRWLLELERAYEQQRQPQGLPLSYQVALVRAL